MMAIDNETQVGPSEDVFFCCCSFANRFAPKVYTRLGFDPHLAEHSRLLWRKQKQSRDWSFMLEPQVILTLTLERIDLYIYI